MKEFDCTISAIIQEAGEFGQNEIKQLIHSIDGIQGSVRFVFCKYVQVENRVTIYTAYNDHKSECTINREIYETDFISDFFREYVLHENEEQVWSKRHFLITLGHGAGLAYFPEVDLERIKLLLDKTENDGKQYQLIKDIYELRKLLSANLSVLPKNSFSPFLNALFAAEKDQDVKMELISSFKSAFETRIITAQSFSRQLRNSFDIQQSSPENSSGSFPIDIFININCYMQMFETGYQFSDVVKYFVASEIGIPESSGINYKDLFQNMAQSLARDTSSREIAKEVVNHFASNVNWDQAQIFGQADEQKSISVNDLSFYLNINKSLTVLSLFLIGNICKRFDNSPLLSFIDRLRDKLTSGIGFVDFSKLLNEFDEFLPDFSGNNSIKELLHTLKNIVDDSLVCIFNSPQISVEHARKGMSIFFPSPTYNIFRDNPQANKIVEQIVENYINNSFDNLNWDEFMFTYIDCIKNSRCS